MTRWLMLLSLCAMLVAEDADTAAVSAEDASVRRLLLLTPQILATGEQPASERLRAGVANIFRSQEVERARLTQYRDAPDDESEHAPFLMLVGFDPSAREFDVVSAGGDPVMAQVPMTTSSTALAYTIADMGLQFADSTVLGAPGRRYLPQMISMVDERSTTLGGGFAVANRDHPLPGATLTSALALMAAPTLDRKVANADLLRGVIQTYDLILQQLSTASAFAELRSLHRHAVLRIQLGGIPSDFLYAGPVGRITAHARVIAESAKAAYLGTASTEGDEIDDSSLTSWMNSVFNKRYTVNREGIPPAPPFDSYTGDEAVLLGSPKTVDDLVTTTIGLAAAYSTSLASELVAVGSAIDLDVDHEIAEINAFENYMVNVWAVDHSRNADGSINLVKLNAYRAIIRPAMQRARDRAIAYFNERARLSYARGDEVLRSANGELARVTMTMSASLAAAGAVTSEFVDRVLASRLGEHAMPANPLFVVNALDDLRADLERAIAAMKSDVAGTDEHPPLVDGDAIAADADTWLYSTNGWREITAKYEGFPYPAASEAMTIQDHLTGLWISALGAVDALGAAAETDNQPPAIRGAYQAVRGSPYLFMQELGSLADYKSILMGMRDQDSGREKLAVQFSAEFGPSGRLVAMMQDLRDAIDSLRLTFADDRRVHLSLDVPELNGSAMLVGSVPPAPSRQALQGAPLAGGVQGYVPLQANLAGYGVVMAQINHEITAAALRAGKVLSIAQRRLLLRSGLLAVTNPTTALVSPSSLLLLDMRRAVSIQLGRALRDAATYQPDEGIIRPEIPPGALPNTERPSGRYQVELLGDAAASQTASRVATWILEHHDQGMRMQWATYRIAALRIALQDLDALTASAYAQSLVEQQRDELRTNHGVNKRKQQERE